MFFPNIILLYVTIQVALPGYVGNSTELNTCNSTELITCNFTELNTCNSTELITCNSTELIAWSTVVYVPFLMILLISFLLALGFLILFLRKTSKIEKAETAKEGLSTEITFPAKCVITACMLWTFSLINTFLIGTEYYMYDIAIYSNLHMKREEGVALFSVLHVLVLLSRIFISIILKYLPIKPVYHLYFFLGLLAAVCLCVFGLDTKLMLWIFAPAASLFTFPLYALGMFT